MHSYPPQGEMPTVIRRTPIDNERFENLKFTYPWINTQSQNWWNRFMVHQFFVLPQEYDIPDDLCNIQPPEQRPNEVNLIACGVQRQRRAAIHINNQVPQRATEFAVGELIAVRNVEAEFWIAKITQIRLEDDESLYFDYYVLKEGTNRTYEKDIRNTHGKCNAEAVLAHGFTLTTLNQIRLKTLRKIGRML